MLTQSYFPGNLNASANSHTVCKLFFFKEQYSSCHIQLADVDQPLAAVRVESQYYSFFRSFRDAQKVLRATLKLGKLGDEVAVTRTKLGYVLWVHEPDVIRASSKRVTSGSVKTTLSPATCLILQDRTNYRSCYIRMPDVPQKFEAIQYNGHYYSLFRQGTDLDKLLEMAAKLTKRGDNLAIAPTQAGYAICLWEPTAMLA